jgi:hypothetical protein
MTFRNLLFFALLIPFGLPLKVSGQAPVQPVANDSLVAQLRAREQTLRNRPGQVFKQKHRKRKVIVESSVYEPLYAGVRPFLREKTRYFKSGAVYRQVTFKGRLRSQPLLAYRVLNGTVVYAFFLDDQKKPRTIVNHQSFDRAAYSQSK